MWYEAIEILARAEKYISRNIEIAKKEGRLTEEEEKLLKSTSETLKNSMNAAIPAEIKKDFQPLKE